MKREPAIEDIRAAHERIRGYIHRTPVLTCRTIDALGRGRPLFQMRELAEGGGLQDTRGLQRGILPHG